MHSEIRKKNTSSPENLPIGRVNKTAENPNESSFGELKNESEVGPSEKD